MIEPTIICPKCKTEILLTESLAAPLVEATRQQFEEKLSKKDDEIALREQALRDKEKQVSEAKRGLEQQVADQVAEQLKTERLRVIEEESKKAKQANASELETKDRELADLQEVLKSRDEKLAEAQNAQAELIKKQRELDDAKRELELTVAKRVQAELSEVRTQAKREGEEGLKLKVLEKEEQIASMQRQIEELRRKAEQGSQQLQGEAQELELESLLRIKFARDTIDPVPKGEFGGDVLHRVIGPLGQLCGTILWESKRTKNWSDGWLPKLRDDQRAAKAEIALLVTQVLPKGVEAFDFIDGVWVTESRCAIPVAIALRQSLVELATARQAGEGQKTKMELVYQYLTGPRFIPIWIALALMAGAMGTSAQSANSKPSQSIAALKVKAENGDAAAQWSLAFLYEAGRGVPQDYQQAEKWYHKLAEGGNSFAQNHIGFMYNQGLGVPQDYAQSAFWYRKAAEQGDPSAQYNLGLL